MAAVDGFRAESRNGLLGWVEETWLGDEDEADALALRLVDGRRGLVLAADVEAVVPEREYVSVRSGARILELGTPHVVRRAVDGGPPRVAASWQTTGELIEPSKPPGKLRHALLEVRPWRLAPPPEAGAEQSVGRALLVLLPLLGLLIALEIALAFVVAYLVTGRAY
jgi:hypothetical protein